MSNTSAATKLASELSSYSEVILVAHSMGGLVASRFIANSTANRVKTKAVITIGTPYVVSAKCINAMETGEIILVGGSYWFKDLIKQVCPNSAAAYQLLPTSKYSSIVGFPALYVSGTSYNTMSPPLNNTAWGKTSKGTTKLQFATALSFHSSLFGASEAHVKEWSGIPWYTYGGTGEDTISQISYFDDYSIDHVWYSNAGDGTVMMKSAGFGFPYKTYSDNGNDAYEHTALVMKTLILKQMAM